MVKWLTSLALIIALGGSALAGVPARKRDPKMASCCKAALMHPDQAVHLKAKLCCALGCTEPAPTSPSGVKNNFTRSAKIFQHPAFIQPQSYVPPGAHLRLSASSSYLTDSSPPTYIRHLALLI
jgi:hypothetical protein